ncbi:MAG: hypothetical protein ABIR24_09345, partial [Verrucomicrobiota bacterium]
GPLDLNQRLEARGKVKLVTAGPDSDMSLGWFNSAAKDSKEEGDAKNFVGIHVGGPTRIGHYFIPHLATAKGTISKVDQGPILTPGKLFDWSLVYDPAANGGLGEMCVTLGNESVTLKLKPGQKTEGANLDRFGLFTSTAGGQMVKIFLDDLSYTARRSVDEPSPSPKNNSAIYRPSPSLQKPRQSAPIHLGVGPHLFLDEFLIESNTNIGRVVNSPLRAAAIPNPIVTGKGDGNFQPYLTVLRDPATRRFRIWYGAQTAESSASESQLAYMESDDGIQWIRPRRILPTPFLRFGVSIIDQGVNFPHADARYKLGWYAAPVTKGESRPADGTVLGGLKIASSPDGFVWKQLVPPDSTNDVVLMHDHDINGIFRDAVADRYVAIASTLATGETWTGKRRVTLQSFSRDLLRWEKPSYALTPDDRLDEGDTQFYAMDGFLIRGDLRIAMVKILRDDFKPEGAAGIGYTALAWSRDGEHWIRDRTPFFQRDERNEAWDHSHAWIDEQVPVGDEVYFYYAGYMHGHKVNRFEERQIGLVKMQRDRYVAREAGAEQGMITTPLVELSGKTFTLNVNARGGEVRVQIVDRKNKPIKDFTFADCAVIDRDGVSESVRWKQHSNLSPLAGKPLKLQIQMRAAKLYALQFGN